jgi:hypothetical protein
VLTNNRSAIVGEPLAKFNERHSVSFPIDVVSHSTQSVKLFGGWKIFGIFGIDFGESSLSLIDRRKLWRVGVSSFLVWTLRQSNIVLDADSEIVGIHGCQLPSGWGKQREMDV